MTLHPPKTASSCRAKHAEFEVFASALSPLTLESGRTLLRRGNQCQESLISLKRGRIGPKRCNGKLGDRDLPITARRDV
jgi:hypothetical protein